MNWAKTKQSRTLEFIPLSLNRVLTLLPHKHFCSDIII